MSRRMFLWRKSPNMASSRTTPEVLVLFVAINMTITLLNLMVIVTILRQICSEDNYYCPFDWKVGVEKKCLNDDLKFMKLHQQHEALFYKVMKFSTVNLKPNKSQHPGKNDEVDLKLNTSQHAVADDEVDMKLNKSQQAVDDHKVDLKLNGSQHAVEDSKVRKKLGENRHPKLLRIRRNAAPVKDNPMFIEGSCKVPSNLKTAEIVCKIWPTTIACKSYCIYGSTFDEGIERTHFCNYKEDQWSNEFEECKPFVDCKLQLATPGKLKCTDNRITKSPSCQVSCEVYEDKDEVKAQMYDCKSDGTWKPPLPFCVELKGIPLVEAPQVTEHDKISYPKNPRLK